MYIVKWEEIIIMFPSNTEEENITDNNWFPLSLWGFHTQRYSERPYKYTQKEIIFPIVSKLKSLTGNVILHTAGYFKWDKTDYHKNT